MKTTDLEGLAAMCDVAQEDPRFAERLNVCLRELEADGRITSLDREMWDVRRSGQTFPEIGRRCDRAAPYCYGRVRRIVRLLMHPVQMRILRDRLRLRDTA